VRLERRRGDREEDDAATTRLQPPSPACTRRPALGGDLPFFSPSPSPPSSPGGLGTAAPGHLRRRLGRRRWRHGAADRGGATSLDGLGKRRWRRGAADRGGTEGVTEWRVAGFAGSCGLLILSSDICDAGSCGPQTNRYWAATITKSNICGAGLRPR
jgi:hypothetical protein